MARRFRLGRFEVQVRLVLLLLVLLLAALDVVNLILLDRSRAALERAERRRVQADGARIVDAIGPEPLRRALAERGRSEGPVVGATALRRAATRFGLERLALLDQAGRERAASVTSGGVARQTFLDLDADDRAALAAGRAIAVDTDPRARGADARLTAYVPLLDPSGRLVGVVEAIAPVPQLGVLRSRFAALVGLQGAAVLLIGAVLAFFARWVSRPYRHLSAAAGVAGWVAEGKGPESEPDDLVAAFRAIVGKLKEQDAAVEALEREGGGLGVLVRFATNAGLRLSTGVLVLDRQGRIAAMNEASAALLGCTDAESRGRPLAEVPRSPEGLRRLVRVCLEQAQGASREVVEIRMEDGRTGHLGVGVTPAFRPSGEVAGVLVLLSDLTEIRTLQEQARLRENLAAVGHLSAGIAHEFRNALGTILGYARIVEKQSDGRGRAAAREILKEIASVRSVVDEFLLYARPPDPDRNPIEIGSLLRRLASAAPERLAVEVRGEFGSVLADESLLRRAFANLMQNAADAAAADGREIRMTITGRRPASGRALQVELEDDGPGIPAELRDKVFVPFFTTRAKGTGLGLALVQRTLVDLGGSVEVAEGARGGALFRIRLPLATAEVEARIPAGTSR